MKQKSIVITYLHSVCRRRSRCHRRCHRCRFPCFPRERCFLKGNTEGDVVKSGGLWGEGLEKTQPVTSIANITVTLLLPPR